IYARLPQWGYTRHTGCHAAGEFARDDDGDGFCEVHVNTLEGFWSLLRSWLRPHRGISQERLPLYLGFFQFVHNVRRRGKALLGSLIELLVAPRNPGWASRMSLQGLQMSPGLGRRGDHQEEDVDRLAVVGVELDPSPRQSDGAGDALDRGVSRLGAGRSLTD